MNPIAIYSGDLILYWSALVITLGIAACFAMSQALYTSYVGSGRALWVLLPPALIFSVLFCRLLHWHCHTEQYAGLWGAITDFNSGGYILPMAVLGVLLAAKLVERMGFTDNMPRLLDAVAPGAALAVAFIKLSAFFNSSCRSKITVTDPKLQRLPLASPVYAGGEPVYRFATFFAQFLVMLLIFVFLYMFYTKRRSVPMKSTQSRDGHTARMFLLLYGGMELILDSTRYDASFLPINGFVSVVQIMAAVFIVYVLVYYSIVSIKVNGMHFYHFLFWLLFLSGLGGVGACEYLVQRHGDWYLKCYSGMALAIFVLIFVSYGMYRSCCERRKSYRNE